MHGAPAGIPGPRGGALSLGGQRWLACPRTDALTRLDAELTVAA
jgi:hypothetical protein